MDSAEMTEARTVCPKCGKSHYMINGSLRTAVYYPIIVENGVMRPSGHNAATTDFVCLECRHRWSETGGEITKEWDPAEPSGDYCEAEAAGSCITALPVGEPDVLPGRQPIASGLSNIKFATDGDLAALNEDVLKRLESIDEKLGEILNELKGKPNRALHG